MKKLLFFVFVFFVISGMGGIGGNDEENKLPKIPENFMVTITDTDGYTARLSQVSIADGLFFSGSIGKGKHVINFSEIKKVNINQIDEKSVEANISFNDGTSVSLITNGKSKLKGKSKYGVFIITLKDVKEINFLGKEK